MPNEHFWGVPALSTFKALSPEHTPFTLQHSAQGALLRYRLQDRSRLAIIFIIIIHIYLHYIAQFQTRLDEGTAFMVAGCNCSSSPRCDPGRIWSLPIVIQRHVGNVSKSNHRLRASAFNGHVPPSHAANHSVGTSY